MFTDIPLLSPLASTAGLYLVDLDKKIIEQDKLLIEEQAEQKLYGGTGIGLALVNEFATLMGGKVYATSTLGEGSQFYFELPKKVAYNNGIDNPNNFSTIFKNHFGNAPSSYLK